MEGTMPRMNQSLPSVSLYIRITEPNGDRRYERVTRRNPQIATGPNVYCLHFYEDGKRRWATVGTNINEALAARFKKESELCLQSKEDSASPKPSPARPKTLEQHREAFLHDKRTTFKKDGSPLDADTIRSYELVTREFLGIVKRTQPTQITKQDLKDWISKLRERVSHRTVCNLYVSIVCFLHFCGVDHKKLLPQSERPTPVDEINPSPPPIVGLRNTSFFARLSL